MASLAFRVVIEKVDSDSSPELVAGLLDDLGLSPPTPAQLVHDVPLTVAEDLDEDEANDLADRLEEVGAEVFIEDLDDDDDEEEEEEAREPSGKGRGEATGATRALMWIGGLLLLFLLVLMGVTVGSGRTLSLGNGCGGGLRGEGADEQLLARLPQVAGQFAVGLEPDDGVAHGTLTHEATANLSEELEGNACYVWIGLSPHGTDLDMFVRQGGQVVDADEAEDNFPVVRRCLAAPATLDVQVLMFGGQGNWVVQRYRMAGEGEDDLMSLTHRFYSTILLEGGQDEPVGEIQRLKLATGQERSIPVQLDGRWCYAVLAVGETGTDLDMSLANGAGQVVASDDDDDSFPLVRHCPGASAEFQVQLAMHQGSGRAVFRLFRTKATGGPAYNPLGLGGGGGKSTN